MTNRIGEGHMDPLEVGAVHQAMPQGIIKHGSKTSNERPTQGTHATGRGDHRNRSHASPGMSHASQGRNNSSDSDGR